MNEVILHNGEKAGSWSEAWRAECEARFVLGMPLANKSEFFDNVRRRRGEPAFERLKVLVAKVEPHYVLGMPGRDQRRAYLAKVTDLRGVVVAERLRAAVMSLHNAKVAHA